MAEHLSYYYPSLLADVSFGIYLGGNISLEFISFKAYMRNR